MEIMRIIITGFVSGIFHLDNVQFGQFFLARPAFMGIVTGFMNGCPLEGAVMGVLIELLYSDFLPLGGAVPPNGLVAASAAVLLYAYSFENISLAFFVAVLAGAFYSKIEFFLRKKRSAWNGEMEKEISENRFKINKWIAKAFAMESLSVAVFVMGFSFVFQTAKKFVDFAMVFPITDLAFSLLPWILLTALVLKFGRQVRSAKERKRERNSKKLKGRKQ